MKRGKDGRFVSTKEVLTVVKTVSEKGDITWFYGLTGPVGFPLTDSDSRNYMNMQSQNVTFGAVSNWQNEIFDNSINYKSEYWFYGTHSARLDLEDFSGSDTAQERADKLAARIRSVRAWVAECKGKACTNKAEVVL